MDKKKNQINFRNEFFLVVLILGLATSRGSFAAEIRANFNAGVGVSDNIAMTPTDEIEETYGIFGVDFDYTEQTRRLNASVQANLDYIQYLDNTFDDQLIGGMVATAVFTLIDERLTWLIQDNFGQQKLDQFAPARPDNRENINYFRTGPKLLLPIGGRNQLGIDLLYSDIKYETRPYDNNKASATVSLQRRTSETATLSLNAFGERTEYDNDELSPDYYRYEAFLRLNVVGGRNDLGIDVGHTRLDLLEETGTGLVVRVNWSRAVSAFSTFTLGGGTQYSDQGDIFRFNQGRSPDLTEPDETSGLGVPFRSNFANLGYTMNRDRTNLTLQLSWNQEDYEDSDNLDRETSRFDLNLQRDISRSVFASLGGQFSVQKYELQGRKDEYLSVRATLGYRFGAAFDISLGYQFRKRQSNVMGAEFEENRTFLLFTYTPGWAR